GGFARAVRAALADRPELSGHALMLEPGELLVADAGVIQTAVVRIAPDPGADGTRRVHLELPKFGVLASTLNGSFTQRLRTSRTGESGPAVVVGPNSEGHDNDHVVCALPVSLECGDRVEILKAGAYTSLPITTYFV